MVLRNYVMLTSGTAARLHFSDHTKLIKTIFDPLRGGPKPVNSLEFVVDELNGVPCVSAYSILSQKHAQDFAPFLEGKKYQNYDFIILQSGEGFTRDWQVQAILRAK